MDHEKKYNSALERARNYYKGLAPCRAKDELELIFPELRESEDERIRKLLVWQVYRNIEDETNDLAQSVYDGIKGHDPDIEESIDDWKKCLAYLEKQKINTEGDFGRGYDCGYEACLNSHGAEWFEKQKEQKHPNGCFTCDEYKKGYEAGRLNGFTAGYNKAMKEVEQKEQKPAEWSEKDEAMRDNILRLLDCFVGTSECESNPSLSTSYPLYQREIAWLKSLRPSWKPSEDEERLINTSISFLKDFADKGYENAVECIDWLKSKLKNGNSGK